MGVLYFQAEEGIRDVERSRGLGGVYRRLVWGSVSQCECSVGQYGSVWVSVSQCESV